jgi:hypothetical protein
MMMTNATSQQSSVKISLLSTSHNFQNLHRREPFEKKIPRFVDRF